MLKRRDVLTGSAAVAASLSAAPLLAQPRETSWRAAEEIVARIRPPTFPEFYEKVVKLPAPRWRT